MVTITINGKDLELGDGQEIEMTKQVADVFELASVACSYTNSFKVPKTPNNTMILQQLGIPGDGSLSPYSKISAALKSHGLPLINKGWLSITGTDDEYSIGIIDGMIDFFKAIENLTMGAALDLSNFNHEKDIDTVVASFTNQYYKYIVADYGGKTKIRVDDDIAINIDYLVPCFNVGKLFALVMSTFGYTYGLANVSDLNDLYVTYPKSPAETIAEDLYATFTKGNYTSGDSVAYPAVPGNFYVPSQQGWNTSIITTGATTGDAFIIPEDGTYRFEFTVESYVKYIPPYYTGLASSIKPTYFGIEVNGQLIKTTPTDPLAPVSDQIAKQLNQGDVVRRVIYAPAYQYSGYDYYREFHHNSTELKIYKTTQDISLSDAFNDFKISEFIKECIIWLGVTPVLNNDTNHIDFYSIEQRTDPARSVDWTTKYVARTNETYISPAYAQKNRFKHKYNDVNDFSFDGFLTVNNQNLDDEKNLFESKIFAPEQSLNTFDSTTGQSFSTRKYRIWNSEASQDSEGNTVVTYKGLTGRFFFMKYTMSSNGSWLLASESSIDTATVSAVPYADMTTVTFDQVIPDKYRTYQGVLNNMRIHEIELALGLADFNGFDPTRPVYFQQESAYYICNRLIFKENQPIKGEFVKINRALVPDITRRVIVSMLAQDGYAIRFRIPISDGFNALSSVSININGFTYTAWGGFAVNESYMRIYISIPVPQWQPEPVVNSFQIIATDGTNERTMTYAGPDVIFTFTNMNQGTTKTASAIIS